MFEIAATRSNPMIDPALRVWGWEIPVYLFLGGLVAGMMILSGWLRLTGRGSSRLLAGLGLLLLSAGMLALFLDLEHKAYVWRLYTTFQPASPMSWGAWILLLVYPALAAAAFLRERRGIALLGMVLGVLLGIYTGVLLSSLGARPLWNSALLGPLFLVSGLSSAAAFAHLVSRNREASELLVRADRGLLVAELALLLLFFLGLLSGTQAHIEAAGLLLGGPYTALFWVFVVGIGIVLPLILPRSRVAPLLVLAGGLALRFVIVYAGQLSHWRSIAWQP